MTQIPFDQLAKEFLQELLTPLGTVERSFEVPGEPRLIDVWFQPHPSPVEKTAPQTLLERITATPCAFEPFRKPPTRQEIRGCLLKLLWVQDEALRQNDAIPDSQLPILWILSSSVSKPILKEGKAEVSEDWLPGIYFCGNLFKTVLVVIQELPETEETLWLRLLGSGTTQEKAVREVLALPVDDPQRQRILQMLTSWKVRMELIGTLDTEDEAWLMALSQAYLEWEQQTEQRGEQRGEERGRQEGERSLILLLLTQKFGSLPDRLAEQISTLRREQLEALAVALLNFSRLTDLERWLEQDANQPGPNG
ncbi:DUF4351 domain-containing protein [Stenomitos frigidus]|uniref:Flagellar assembly protein H n=1 Tax=Stenomitos frigidus ULC18 TaxID=2107698 RepID=A0A2T1EHS9_9CYAN|nr:DUF4351 domain-containing protein [Stenomitos frigidus]PSB32320.1 flagellar assembly protein H [Stenomitos frigidus ULC18]